MISLFFAWVAVAAEPDPPPSILTVAQSFTDLGTVAPGAEVSFTLGVSHTQGPAIALEGARVTGDPDVAFDEVVPELPADGSAVLGFTFASTTPGPHEATIEVRSDADCTEPVPVTVRAWVSAPCLALYPDVLDFGPVAAGTTGDVVVRVAPCAGTPLELDGLLADGTVPVTAELPMVVGAAGGLLRFTAAPADDAAAVAQLDLTAGGIVVASLFARVNDCPNGDPELWDADGDGISDCGAAADPTWVDDDGDGSSENGGDCDDADDAVGPEADEATNAVDDDCDGLVDEHLDGDGDGVAIPIDCDDADPWVNPGSEEVVNGADDDCDGSVDESGLPSDTCPPWDQPPAEATNSCSCGGSGPAVGWWVVVGLVALRRRR